MSTSNRINWKEFAARNELSYQLVRVVRKRYRNKINVFPKGGTLKILLAMSRDFEEPVLPIISTLRILEQHHAL
jgi:hypothetical protein